MKYTVAVWAGLGALAAVGACTQLPLESSAAASTTAFRASPRTPPPPDSAGYERRAPRDPNGIGLYYQGRQIAHVMGHEGADWLERDDRPQDEGTDLLLKELALKPTDDVADIGAGTGYFSFRMARLVPRGEVLAVDIQPEMIIELKQRQLKNGLANVQPTLGTTTNPHLPANSLDLVLIVDAYHEFDHPREMGRAIAHSLRPGTGRLALVEYRAEDPNVPIKAIHKMTVAQAKKEMQAVGLKLVQLDEQLPQQHLMFFQRQ
ncbi:methyltransferase domain-containing protein [Hymenobacter sp. RP-2-7]|uniref:Methyltransferase domain-containing protein n=1 Tax=Hymenobacter polaris TaxID=2682546 RepID=A0A7Y0AF47_9BACT|nr:methyltransferase domain-containing protein [Hymenobacter polaris]NML66251.1 methyltransferase domain-containing protein [Hymenobacter polaris]